MNANPEEAPIYVDELFYFESHDPIAFKVGAKSGHQWCHLWSSDVDRLHWMAERIGMRREWFQDKRRGDGTRFPHYDLVPSKRKLAIAFGARVKDLRSWIEETRAGIQQEKTERTEKADTNCTNYHKSELQQANLL